MKKNIVIIAAVALILASCGGNEKVDKEVSKEVTKTEIPQAAEVEEVVVSETEVETVNNIELLATDQMTYDKNELHVKSGEEITLTLTHTGEMPKSAMGHNFVLLAIGTDIPAFATKAMEAKDNDYIPEGDEIIAHTGLIGGGESVTITFEAPESGTYDYICSFPGHYAIMKGKLIVE